MALATYLHTPIKDLDDLLRYLTEDSAYTKGVAGYVANQRYKDGHLRLTKVEYVGVKPQGEVPIDPEFGHIEVHRGRMRFVPREPLWRKAIYRIAEGCDARAIWPAPSAPIASAPIVALPPPCKPTAPPKKTNPITLPKKPKRKTQHTKLIDLMEELHLETGMLPRDVRTDIEPAYKNKHHVAVAPSRSAITRAYNDYETALIGTAKPPD